MLMGLSPPWGRASVWLGQIAPKPDNTEDDSNLESLKVPVPLLD